MSWRALTEADLLTAVTGAELEGYREAALATGQVDPVAPSIKATTDVVRGHVAGCARNTLEEGDTIPDELVQPAVDICVYLILKRVPGQSPSDARAKGYDDAMDLLKRVADCKFAVSRPTTPEAEMQKSTGIEVIEYDNQRVTREKLGGF